jgi:hypothetical protein
MKSYLKYGVSAIAILAAFSLAQAQERQGGEREGAQQHMQSQQGGGAMKGEGAGQRQGATKEEGGAQRQGAMEKGNAAEKGATARAEKGTAQNRTAQEERGKAETGNKSQQAERGNMKEENRAGTEANKGQRAAKNAPTEEQRTQNRQREGERNPQSNEYGQRESNVGAAGKNETLGRQGERPERKAALHISGAQKTRLHDALVRDTSLRRYNRGQVHFALNTGTVIPGDFELYSPPPTFVDIYPDFRYYKIVVVGDEILVVDPATREIVDVIYL